VSSYKVSVGNTTVRAENFRDARSVVAEAITSLLARDPEAGARGAVTVNLAFDSGAVEHSLTAHGRWSTTVTVDGEPVLLAIVKKRWWLLLGLPVVRVVGWLVFGCLVFGVG
jgi:hypothetical protein